MEQYREAYPQVKLFAVPGLDRKREDLRFDGLLSGAPEREWQEDLDQMAFEGWRRLHEIEFFHRRTRTLITGDLCCNFDPLMRVVAQGRVRQRLGPPTECRILGLVRDRRAVRRSLGRILDWDFERSSPATARSSTSAVRTPSRRALPGSFDEPGPLPLSPVRDRRRCRAAETGAPRYHAGPSIRSPARAQMVADFGPSASVEIAPITTRARSHHGRARPGAARPAAPGSASEVRSHSTLGSAPAATVARVPTSIRSRISSGIGTSRVLPSSSRSRAVSSAQRAITTAQRPRPRCLPALLRVRNRPIVRTSSEPVESQR